MDYFDILLAKKLNGGGGGDIDLQTLNVIENGTVNAPSGVAYNKVITNVPAPSNAIYKQTLSGLPSPIATFTGADAPIDSLKASIVGIQSGSGDPSPTNIRPISGWTGCVVNKTGKNLFSIKDFASNYMLVSGSKVGRLTLKLLPNTTYTISTSLPLYTATSTSCFTWSGGGTDESPSSSNNGVYLNNPRSVTTDNNGQLTVGIFVEKPSASSSANTYEDVLSGDYYIQCEVGETATAYEPFGNTYTIPFKDSSDNPITVYDGGIDISGGKLTVTHANIVSYNGETINEPWISSEDVYTQGATPTTGAQVVYPLTTPLVYEFKPLALRSNGVTNISVDCGEVTELKYYSNTP